MGKFSSIRKYTMYEQKKNSIFCFHFVVAIELLENWLCKLSYLPNGSERNWFLLFCWNVSNARKISSRCEHLLCQFLEHWVCCVWRCWFFFFFSYFIFVRVAILWHFIPYASCFYSSPKEEEKKKASTTTIQSPFRINCDCDSVWLAHTNTHTLAICGTAKRRWKRSTTKYDPGMFCTRFLLVRLSHHILSLFFRNPSHLHYTYIKSRHTMAECDAFNNFVLGERSVSIVKSITFSHFALITLKIAWIYIYIYIVRVVCFFPASAYFIQQCNSI